MDLPKARARVVYTIVALLMMIQAQLSAVGCTPCPYYSEEVEPAPVQAVRTTVRPCALLAATAAVVGVAVVIVTNSTSSSVHSPNS